MELSYKTLKSRSSLIKTATGISLKEFDYLQPVFKEEWEKYISIYTFEGKLRKRMRTVRKNSTFKCSEDMLIFILYDYRHNPTQEFMGLHFQLRQSKVALWIKVLEPMLLNCLARLKLTPVRESDKLDCRLIESVTVLLDGTERPINRPKYDQNEYFSGKKTCMR
jgi:hypothetical protein